MDLIDPKFGVEVFVITEDKQKYQSPSGDFKPSVVAPEEVLGYEANGKRAILVDLPEEKITESLLSQIFKVSQAGGQIVLTSIKSTENLEFALKIAGFVDVKSTAGSLQALKPKYAIGSSAKLNLKPAANVWKLDDDDQEEEETIDPDDLLDDDDLKKPDASSLRVCGTTGKRKACKDCSCGLADELASEVQSGKVVNTADAPKSSCGSCYLGDAFRCASCPYMGMPAFKPGEKIQLSDNFLKADI